MRSPPPTGRGLVFFAERIVEDVVVARARLVPARVKRIRTSLRRVRAMCEILTLVDDDPLIDELRRTARDLMRVLGPLRDHHVQQELLLDVVGSPLPPAFARVLEREAAGHRTAARTALAAFDRRRFMDMARRIGRKVARIGDDHPGLVHVAYERLAACRPLLVAARADLAAEEPLHTLRIGLKRFRYVVESFLPAIDTRIGVALKALQDLTGEIHDLDVARNHIERGGITIEPPRRRRALARIAARRRARVRKVQALAARGLLRPYFAALPRGAALEEAAVRRLVLWRDARDPLPGHSDRVTALAQAIHRALVDDGALPDAPRDAHVVRLGALLHDVGRRGDPSAAHAKASARAIRALGALPPLGPELVEEIALVARHHEGAPAHRRADRLSHLDEERRGRVIALAAIVRVANAIDLGRGGPALVGARVEGETCVVTVRGGTCAWLDARERRAFTRAVRRDLAVVRILDGARGSVRQAARARGPAAPAWGGNGQAARAPQKPRATRGRTPSTAARAR